MMSTMADDADVQMMDGESSAGVNVVQDGLKETAKGGDGASPRLVITRMELENFKSYAGVQQIGIFHKCFSAVVGPNGSGKSNVIDAMLFVFGKRAKQLRLHKVSELIHNSSAVIDNPLTFARVSVFFEEIVDTGPADHDYVVTPNSEIVVSRIAYKNNTSTYKINNKNCQFREVAQYLGSKGIDLDNNRFLILQGEVEMISMMPPKGKNEGDDGLLEYLEDIIGSNKFVEATNEAEARVEALTEQRQERLNRVKAVQKEKDSLESAKREAQSLLQKDRDIRRKQNILYQIYAHEAHQESEKMEQQSQQYEEKLLAERENMSQASLRVNEIEKGLAEKRRTYDEVYNELKETKEKFTSYERRDIKLREEVKHLNIQETKLKAKISSEEQKIVDSDYKKEEAEESIPSLESKLEELTEVKVKENTKLEGIYDEIKDIANSLRADLQSKTEELAPVQQELSAFESALETSESQIQLLEDSTKRAREKLTMAEEEVQSLDLRKAEAVAKVEAYETEVVNGQERIAELDRDDEVCGRNEADLETKRGQVMTYIERAKSNIRNQGTVRSSAVRGILKAARNGGNLADAGVIGRLGDLATIPEEFDVAISTACGMLDYVVVKTTAGAQRCLEFLRKHNLGRANFVPLDKMKKGAHDRVVETPEGAPRLFDLISPSNFAIVPAIFLAVADTLVAPDLETATRWAYEYNKRWRVVTVDGKLIETTGTMAGGGKNVRKGGMRLANKNEAGFTANNDDETSDQIKSYEAELADIDTQIQQLKDQRRLFGNEKRTLVKRLKHLEGLIPKLKLEIDNFDSTRAAQVQSIPELRSLCVLNNEDSLQLEALQESVQQCKVEMKSCADLAAKLSEEVGAIQKSILEAGGPKLSKQQKKCEKLQQTINEIEDSLRLAKIAIGTSEKARAKAEKVKTESEDALEKTLSLLQEKKDELQSLEDDALEVMKMYETVKTTEAEKRIELDMLIEESEELQKVHSGLKCGEIEIVGKIESLKTQQKVFDNKVKHWNCEIAKIQAAAGEEDEDAFSDADESDIDCDNIDETKAADGSSEEDEDVIENMPTKVKSSLSSLLPALTAEVLAKYDASEVKEDIAVLEAERKNIAKNANMGAIAEYRKKESDYSARVAELDAVSEERTAVRKAHEDLRRQRLEMFMDAFSVITLKLKEMYQMITQGGDAELELVDSLDPFSEGVVFSVRPPKKSWKNISNLSGGEKTLSSLALVFALHHFKPTPLYVMDEIDAALDFKNVSIVANYIKDRTKDAQFIIISLRNNMFELADRLIGIYKTNNCTKSVTVNPRAFSVDCQQNGRTPSTPALRERSNRTPSAQYTGLSSTLKDKTGAHDSITISGDENVAVSSD